MSQIDTAHDAAAQLAGWLGDLPAETPLAVILGGSCNGLSFVRSLGRRRVPTLMLDTERLLGAFTRFGKVVLLPSVEAHPDAWVAFLGAIAQRFKTPAVLIPTSDPHCQFISRHREALAASYRFLIPDPEALEAIIDKRRQYDIAKAAGVPIPDVRFPESVAEATAFAADMSYPCVLKPYVSHSARAKLKQKKVAVVGSAEELTAEYEPLDAAGVPMMIQEIIPGDDTQLYGYLAYWNEKGEEVAWITKRKLRQYPPGFGDGSFQISVEAPEVAELSRRLLRHFNYRGFVGVEFKYDARDASYRLMEINPRTVSGNQLAISAGVDFPLIGYQHLAGRPFDAPAFRPNVRYVNEEWDVQAFLTLSKAGKLDLVTWLKSILGAEAYALGAWDDPKPLLAGLGRAFRMLRQNGQP